jgi:hypothetical protein
MARRCRNITGTTANGDGIGGIPNHDWVEPCNTIAWFEVMWHMFRITGEAKYAQEMELTLYNQLLGAENPRSGANTSNEYINGVRGTGNGSGGASSGGCCGTSTIKGMGSIADWCMSGTVNGNAAIVQYFPATFTIALTKPESRTLSITMSTSYPENGNVTIAVQSSSAGTYPIMLRVPDWCTSFTASVGGQQYSGVAGSFLAIQRAWGTNETIQVTMAMTVRVVNDPNPSSTLKAIQRGPQLMSLDPTVTGPTLPAGWWGNQVYAYQVNQGGAKTWYMVPYAEAGQTGSTSSVLLASFTLQATAAAPMRIAAATPSCATQALSHRVLSVDGRTIQNDKRGVLAQRAAGVYVDQAENGISKVNRLTGNAR